MSLIRIIKKFKLILTGHQKLRIVELVVLMLVGGFLETMSVSLMVPFMNAVMKPEEVMKNDFVHRICILFHLDTAREFLLLVAILLAVLYIVKNAYLLFEYNIQYRFVYGNMFAMQERLLDVFLHRPYEFFLGISSGEVTRIIGGDTSSSFQMLMTMLTMLTELIVSLMLVAAIFVITPTITITIAVVMLLLLLIINAFIKPLMRQSGKKTQEASAGMTKWLLQSIQGIKELKVMKKENYFRNSYNRYGVQYVSALRQSQTYALVPKFFIEAICMSVLFFVVAILIYTGSDLQAIVPMLSAVAMAAIRLLPSVNRISQSLAQISYNEPMLDKLIENLNTVDNYKGKGVSNKGLHVNIKNIDRHFNNKIELENIYYHYPNSQTEVFQGASLTINKGESVGIVGSSGAGKTTAVDIMLGLLSIQEGRVLVDGEDIRDNMDAWLHQVGYIPQSIFMLDDSIKNNIAFGDNVDGTSDERVWSAIRDASLEDFVKELPENIETQIGERGVRLSGGQRQRIGIARALYSNPSILFFDEATSALDNETESAIMDSINGLRGRKTMIIIAHRLSTIELCDHVYKVENGLLKKIR